MYAMQYAIPLPTDYDMEIIRDRVRRTGHLMDGFAGLAFKAYAIQEKAHGAPRNAYAPFYVWADTAGMRDFCWGEPGYSAIVRDFGRHPIRDWTVHELAAGPADPAQARSLTLRTLALPEGPAPSVSVPELAGPFLAEAGDATVARVAAVDVTRWELLLAELSTAEADQGGAEVTAFEVLHVSQGPAA